MNKRQIHGLAGFDMNQRLPSEDARQCTMPALFLHGGNDSLIHISHMEAVFDNYSGDKTKMEIQGNHNTARAAHVYKKIATYV